MNSNKVWLSASSLTVIHESLHNWVNKQILGQGPNNKYFEGGRQGGRVIQEHISGKAVLPELAGITYKFPVVEEKLFDDRCKFVKNIEKNGVTYIVQGFADGLDKLNKRLAEIKLSSNPWSLGKFESAYQRKMYKWGFPEMTEAILITGPMFSKAAWQEINGDWEKWKYEDWKKRLLEVWYINPPTQHRCTMTDKDAEEAEKWIMDGIERLENMKEILDSSDASTGLIDGKCVDNWCNYGALCTYK